MKKLCLIVLLASSPCFAQTPEHSFMPDGSRDRFMGLSLVSRSSHNGDPGARDTLLFPLLNVRWSNGVFASGSGTLGMHLSDTLGLEYGPVLHWHGGRRPSGRQNLAGSDEIKESPDVGGFFNYYLGRKLKFTSELLSTTDSRGMLLKVGIQKNLPPLAPHHTVALRLDATAADSAYAMHYYGIVASAAPGSAVQDYSPTGGLLAVSASMNWNWALSSSWIVIGGLWATSYAPMAADSPVIGKRSAIAVESGLVYRF